MGLQTPAGDKQVEMYYGSGTVDESAIEQLARTLLHLP